MKRLILFVYIAISISGSFLYGAEGEDSKGEKKVAVPNPIELEKDWWEYFNVPQKEVPAKIDTFKASLEKFLSFSDESEHEEILKEKEEIYLNLDLWRDKLNQMLPSEPPALQLRKQYTPQDLLKINQKILETQRELSQIDDKIKFRKSRVDSLQGDFDKEIIHYYQTPGSSYEKLYSGMKIISLRSEMAIYKTELENLGKIAAYRKKQADLLSDELKNARKKINYSALNHDELLKNQGELDAKLAKAEKKLEDLERRSLRQDKTDLKTELFCCLINYQIITQTILVENYKVLGVVNDIQLTLYDIEKKEDGAEGDVIREKLANWDRVISEAKESIRQWQKRLENDHVQVSKMISEKLREDNEEIPSGSHGVISDIHLEIDQSFALIQKIRSNISGAEQLIQLVQSKFVEEKSIAETWTYQANSYWIHTLEWITESISVSLFYVNDYPVTIGTLLKAIFTIVFAFVFSSYLRRALSDRLLNGRRFSKSTKYIVLRLIHYLILIFAVLLALNFIGIDLTNIAIVAGALGVGIGFGLQSMVNNILSGFTLLLNRYLKVGDIVEVEGGTLATVTGINLQFTQICTYDGADKIIPNSELSARGLTNWTMRNSYRRFRIPFGVAYGTDKDHLKDAILEQVKKQPYVVADSPLYPDPQVWFMEYGDSSVNFELVAWVNLSVTPPHGTATSSLLWVIDNVLNEEGISIPFPQRDLRIKEFPENWNKGERS